MRIAITIVIWIAPLGPHHRNCPIRPNAHMVGDPLTWDHHPDIREGATHTTAPLRLPVTGVAPPDAA